jgi:hypothetical protein
MKFDLETMTERDMCHMFPLLKQRLFELKLYKTGHAFSKAEQKIGWEVAENAQNSTKNDRKRG